MTSKMSAVPVGLRSAVPSSHAAVPVVASRPFHTRPPHPSFAAVCFEVAAPTVNITQPTGHDVNLSKHHIRATSNDKAKQTPTSIGCLYQHNLSAHF